MLTIQLSGVRRILCLGAHADDIEIGCAGTLLGLMETNLALSVRWIVFSASGERASEAQASAEKLLAAASSSDVVIERFRDGFFPYQGEAIKQYMETLKEEETPDLIFTHFGQDLHQDHRLISELSWNTFRDHFILEYEVPKYDGDLKTPNVFVPLSDSAVEKKLRHLIESFPSQTAKPWFDADTFRSLMRLRGMECNSPTRYGEGFHARKVCLQAH